MSQIPTIQQTDKLLLTVEEAASLLSLHRARIFPLLAAGRIRSLKIGRNRRIPRSELEAFIAEELAAQQEYQPWKK